jgi:hypothetical protein
MEANHTPANDHEGSDVSMPHRPLSLVVIMGFCVWVIQQFLAWWVPMFVVSVVFTLPGLDELTGSPLGNVGLQIVHGIAVGIGGYLLGFSLLLMFPPLKATGRWIWALPVAALLFAVISDVRTFGWGPMFGDLFFSAHPGRDEGPILRDFLTYPALSCICYSLAMVFGGKAHRPTGVQRRGQRDAHSA